MKNESLNALGLIKHSKKYLSSDILDKNFRSLDKPHLSYCCSVFGACSINRLNSLYKIQNSAAIFVSSSRKIAGITVLEYCLDQGRLVSPNFPVTSNMATYSFIFSVSAPNCI